MLLYNLVGPDKVNIYFGYPPLHCEQRIIILNFIKYQNETLLILFNNLYLLMEMHLPAEWIPPHQIYLRGL